MFTVFIAVAETDIPAAIAVADIAANVIVGIEAAAAILTAIVVADTFTAAIVAVFKILIAALTARTESRFHHFSFQALNVRGRNKIAHLIFAAPSTDIPFMLLR